VAEQTDLATIKCDALQAIRPSALREIVAYAQRERKNHTTCVGSRG
jgi:hypothetical protein